MSLGLLSANFLKHSLFLYPPFGDFRSPSSHSGALWILALCFNPQEEKHLGTEHRLWKKLKLSGQRPLKWAIYGDHILGFASLLVSDLAQMFFKCSGVGLILAAIATKFPILKMVDLISCT